MATFVTYITVYEGNKMPSFYIGSTSKARHDSGYVGSVRSKNYRDIWKSELKNNPHLFDSVIIDEFECREDSLKAEEHLQRKHKVVTSQLFINMGIARGGFINPGFFTEEQLAKMSASAKARGVSKDVIDAGLAARTGMKDSEETKARRNASIKVSQTKRIAVMTPEQRKKTFGAHAKGKPWSEARRLAQNAKKVQA